MQKINLKLNGYDWQVYLRDEADRSVFNEIFKLKEYRSAEIAIKNAKYAIVDAGAHVGFFTMYCRSLNKKAKIYAVEPETNNLKLLKRHFDENKISGVKVIAGALAFQTEERKLALSADSHNHRLSPIGDNIDKQISVQAFSLADFCQQNKIKKISLLKMDIEGGEHELFDGMSEADLSVVNFIILEYHTISNQQVSRLSHKQIEEKLRANGFGVQIFPSHFDKTMGFVWANNKRTKFKKRLQ
jgi:FkbM family methyltransferase